MALNNIDYNLNVRAPGVDSEVNKVVSGVNKIAASTSHLDALTNAIHASAGAFAALYVVREVGSAIVGLAQKADAMTQAFNKVRIASDLTSQEQDRLHAAIIKASGATRLSYEESASAAKNLLQAGLDVGSTIQALTPVLGLSQIGETGTEEMAKLVAMLGRFGISGENIGLAFDKMFKATKISTLDAKELVQILAKAGPGALAAGVGFDQMLASLSLLRSGMANASTAGTLFGRAMRTFIDPKALQKIADTFGVVTIQGGKLRDPLTLMNELAQVVGKSAEKAGVLGRIMGVQGSAPVLASLKAFQDGLVVNNGELKKGADLVQYFNEQITNTAGGEGAAALAISMESLGAQADRLKNSLGISLGVILKSAGEGLTSLVKGVANLVSNFNSFMVANRGVADAVGAVVGIGLKLAAVATAMIGIAGAARLASVAVGLLRATFGALTGPVGIILTIASLLPTIYAGVKSIFGLGNDSMQEATARGADQTVLAAKAMKDGAEAQEGSADATKAAANALKEQVTRFEKTLDAPGPILDPKILDTAMRLKGVIGSVFGPEAVEKLAPHMKVLGQAVAEMRTAGGITAGTMHKLFGDKEKGVVGSLSVLKAEAMREETLGRIGKGTTKQFGDVETVLAKMVSPEGVLTRTAWGMIHPEYMTEAQRAAATSGATTGAGMPVPFNFVPGAAGAPTVNATAEFRSMLDKQAAAEAAAGPTLLDKVVPGLRLARRVEAQAQSELSGAVMKIENVFRALDAKMSASVLGSSRPIELVIDGARLPGIMRAAGATESDNQGVGAVR